MITKIAAYSIGSVVSLLAVGTIFNSDIARYDDHRAVIIFGIILGLLTAFVKPVLSVLTLPITCLTFGVFALVLNAGLFGLAARLTSNVEVSVPGAIIGGVFAAVINGVIFSVADDS